MFYYYFKSKQDIYIAAMEQYITQRLERKCKIIEDETVSFDEKLPIFRSMVEEDIQGYMERFAPQADTSISDTSYKLYDLVHMLGRMVIPYSKFILQGIRENRLNNRFPYHRGKCGGFCNLCVIRRMGDDLQQQIYRQRWFL